MIVGLYFPSFRVTKHWCTVPSLQRLENNRGRHKKSVPTGYFIYTKSLYLIQYTTSSMHKAVHWIKHKYIIWYTNLYCETRCYKQWKCDFIYGYRNRRIGRPLRWWVVSSPCGGTQVCAGVLMIVVDHDCRIGRSGCWVIKEWSRECSHGILMSFLMAKAAIVWWPCPCGHITFSSLYWQKGIFDWFCVVSIHGLWPMTHESSMTHTQLLLLLAALELLLHRRARFFG